PSRPSPLSLHDALPILTGPGSISAACRCVINGCWIRHAGIDRRQRVAAQDVGVRIAFRAQIVLLIAQIGVEVAASWDAILTWTQDRKSTRLNSSHRTIS